MPERVMVTGGAGFIGSTIADRLLEDGFEVIVLDNFSTGSLDNLSAAQESGRLLIDEADIRSEEIRAILARRAPDVVIHMAAQIDVRVSVLDPVLDADINILGTLNVVEASIAAGVRKVVIASSGGSIYGDESPPPFDEDTPGRPQSPYAIGKRVLRDYLEFYGHVHGLDFALLALSNVYGPRQDSHGEAGVIAMFLGAMLSGAPTTIYGDGSQTRDFVYVADVADAFRRAVDAGHGLINIGTGIETTVNELWQTCAKAAGFDGSPVYAPPRAGELQRNALNCAKAERELGWRAQTPLTEGIAATSMFIEGQLSGSGSAKKPT